MKKQYLTAKEISEAMGVSESKAYGIIRELNGDRKKTTMENGKIFENLIKICRCKELSVLFTPFKANCGLIRGKRIGVANDLNIDDINKTLAHEIAHLYLHKGKDILSIRNEEYEKQADQAADMLLDILQIVICAQE